MSKTSVLPAGMRLVGEVAGDEDLVIFGTVDGEIEVGGAVTVECTGTVRGNVRGRTVVVLGLVLGDATATDAIRVDRGGRMVGDVHAPRVNIVKGARFRGHVDMVGAADPRQVEVQEPNARRTRGGERRRRGRERREAERPTVPGTVRSARQRDTIPGSAPAVLEDGGEGDPFPSEPGPTSVPPALPSASVVSAAARTPPPPFIPLVRRTRARRRG